MSSGNPTLIRIIGATGRSGVALSRALQARGQPTVSIIRDPAKYIFLGLKGEPNMADLADAQALAGALRGAQTIVSTAHARHIPAILAASPAEARFVFLGSTRRFSRFPDDHGDGVRAGEAAFLASGRNGVILHPTMIYGAEGEDNVRRLAALMRRLPVLPLPGGGANLVQPIHQDDLTACLLAALDRTWSGPHSVTVAGPEAVTYADFARAIATATGQRPPRIAALPARLLMALVPLTRLPFLPRVEADEIQRLLEDKVFPIEAMRALLGITPRPLAEGLRMTFG